MKALVLGFSNIARRRALPALLDIPSISAVDIASRHGADTKELPGNWKGHLYNDYATALSESNADIVYISLINSLHETWAESALRSGRHVIVDKPATLSLAATERLLALAKSTGVCLAEATVFSFHAQFDQIAGLLDNDTPVTRLITAFSFPPFAASDFRNFPEFGGGALLDLGPYAAAASRLFFSAHPRNLVCRINSRHAETGVETAFSILATYPGGGSYVGHFGFDTEYQNRLMAFGPGISVTLDRAFTTPPEMENAIELKQNNAPRTVRVPACDAFAGFFRYAVESIEKRDWGALNDTLLQDATFREQLQISASEEQK
ncbi:MAG: Gfo/Idh/MocA family oxidoreductase [Thiogranum sp.]|nr:Gfo/Idh/MocA family oxidoreductase [Thiogranum sp.]